MKTDETHGGKTEMTQRNPLLFFMAKDMLVQSIFNDTCLSQAVCVCSFIIISRQRSDHLCKTLAVDSQTRITAYSDELFGLCNITLSLVDQKLVQTTMKGLQ